MRRFAPFPLCFLSWSGGGRGGGGGGGVNVIVNFEKCPPSSNSDVDLRIVLALRT